MRNVIIFGVVAVAVGTVAGYGFYRYFADRRNEFDDDFDDYDFDEDDESSEEE